ncbi:MAG: hypothetical protein ACLU8S_03085 [Coprococcus phoceensis]
MTVYQRVVIIAAVCLCIGGIMMLLDVPFMTKGMKQKYADESITNLCYKKAGVCYVIMASKVPFWNLLQIREQVLYDAAWVLFYSRCYYSYVFIKGFTEYLNKG